MLAAVDLSPGSEDLADSLRLMIGRILSIEGEARIACVNILKTSRIAVDILEDEEGRSLHVQRLVQLRHWGASLDIPSERISYSVLEAPDPAAALVDYARRNNVDHIVIGARASSALRRYLGSVSSQVVAEAPCSVTVVRTAKDRRTDSEPTSLRLTANATNACQGKGRAPKPSRHGRARPGHPRPVVDRWNSRCPHPEEVTSVTVSKEGSESTGASFETQTSSAPQDEVEQCGNMSPWAGLGTTKRQSS